MVRSLRNVLVLIGIVLLAAACPGPPGGGGNEDRPPIIVSDGSVHLRMVAKDLGRGTNNARGTWEKDATSGAWYHAHGNQPARRLYVNVLYGSGGANCDNPAYPHDVRSLTIAYNDGAADRTFTIGIEAPNDQAPGRVVTSLTEATATRDAKLYEWLDVVGASHLVSVQLGSATCQLESGKGQVHIYQRIQP